MAHFIDHGTVARTLDANVDEAQAVMDGIAALGIDMTDVCEQLTREGVASFETAFDSLLASLTEKAKTLS